MLSILDNIFATNRSYTYYSDLETFYTFWYVNWML